MAVKEKPIKEAVKALGLAREALRKSAMAERKSGQALAKAVAEQREADLSASASGSTALALADVANYLQNNENEADAHARLKALGAWLHSSKQGADAAAEKALHAREKAESKVEDARQDFETATKKTDEDMESLHAAIQKIPADAVVPAVPASLPPELVSVIRGQPETRSNFLTISQRQAGFDPLVRDALGQISAESRGKHEPSLFAAIVEGGLASEIERITRRLNRSGMPDLRRSILAETYAELLKKALDDGGKLSRERAEDTVGTSDAVLASIEGKLQRFAAVLASRTATKLGLDAPDGSYSHSIIKTRILGQI